MSKIVLMNILVMMLLGLPAGAAPLCSVIFSHDLFADAFADVRHGGAVDVVLELDRRKMFDKKIVPQFQETLEGPSRLKLSEIHFMQSNISNNYSEAQYTVVDNARQIRDGKLDIEKFPPIHVWRDTSGKIWTLDHRRLAAMVLSGKIESTNVVWATRNEVDRQRYKMSTLVDGDYMILAAKRQEVIIVDRPDRPTEKSKFTLVPMRNLPKYAKRLAPPMLRLTEAQVQANPKTAMSSNEVNFSTTIARTDEALALANKIQSGEVSIDTLSLRVWTDSTGRTWTVDNDILAALRLSGIREAVSVRYLTNEEIAAQKFEVDSQTGGRTYVIPLEGQPNAMVVH